MVFLDDAMAEKIDGYQAELLVFWNWAVSRRGTDEARQRLDHEIPTYLSRLRRDINTFLDPKYRAVWLDPRLVASSYSQRSVEIKSSGANQ